MTRTDVLLLGGTSPIGRRVAHVLDSHRTAFVSTSRSGTGRRLDLLDTVGTRETLLDVRPRCIISLANPVNTAGAADLPAIDAWEAFVRNAAAAGCERIVFASSSAVYGDAGTRPFAEWAPRHGTTDYARLKIRMEDVLTEASAQGSLSGISLRLFNVYGVGLDKSLINRLAYGDTSVRLRLGAPFVRDYIHVDDVANAIHARISAADLHSGGVVTVGTGIGTSNADLHRGARPGSYETYLSDEPSFSVADTGRMREVLQIFPRPLAENP